MGSAALIYNGTLSCAVQSTTESASFVTASAISLNQWHHLAVVRNGSVVKAYLDGTQFGTDQTMSAAISFSSFLIGTSTWWPSQESWQGYLDDFRVTQGVARYLSNFTPPSAAFPDATLGTLIVGKGGMVWLKQRTNASSGYNHHLMDTLRGGNAVLATNIIDPEVIESHIQSFNSNGFTLPADSFDNLSTPYCSWTFRKSAKFFDIVTYTGNGTAGRSINHSLGVTPGMIIIKRRDTASATGWAVWHRSATGDLWLNLTNAQTVSLTQVTEASTSTFTVGNSADVNASGGTYVAYLYAHDPSASGIIQGGSYQLSSGSEITLGWEPQWVMIKNVGVARDWLTIDITRKMDLKNSYSLKPQSSGGEYVEGGTTGIHPTATGFKIEGDMSWADSSNKIIYLAIRRPNKPPTSAFQVFNLATGISNNPYKISSVGIPADLTLLRLRTVAESASFASRLQGSEALFGPANTNAATPWNVLWDTMDGYYANVSNMGLYSNYVNCVFRRAPGILIEE